MLVGKLRITYAPLANGAIKTCAPDNIHDWAVKIRHG